MADAAELAERLRQQVAGLEPLQARLADQRQRALDAGQEDLAAQVARDQAEAESQLAGLRQRLAEVTKTERRLAAQNSRRQRQVDAFRTRKEVLKARRTSALAEVAIDDMTGAAGLADDSAVADDRAQADRGEGETSADEGGGAPGRGGGGGRGRDGSGEGGEGRGRGNGGESGSGGEGGGGRSGESGGGGERDEDVSAAVGRLGEIEQEIERELRVVPWAEDADRPGVAASGGLAELRTGAPEADDTRILFAVEPPGAALLLAVLEGRDALRDHYDEAVSLSAEVLRLVRLGEAPEAAGHVFEDAQSFLDEFFAGEADEVEAGAAFLAARNRARTLAGLRDRLGLSQAEVAARMGVRVQRVAAIERAQPGATEVRALARYAEALGGRLEIAADVGGERVILR
jgi:DNA-binding XRE family transcriptional regulator